MSQPSLVLNLWQSLQAGAASPQAVNLKRLCELLDEAVARVPEAARLAVAGRAIEQMAVLYALRFDWLMAVWEAETAETEAEAALPLLEWEVLEGWVRQSMAVDLESLVEQPQSKHQFPREHCSPADADSLVGVVEPAVLLELVEAMAAEESEQMLRQLAGEEDPTGWASAITEWMQEQRAGQPTWFGELSQGLSMSGATLWLGLLLGGFELEQTGEFYSQDILVRLPK